MLSTWLKNNRGFLAFLLLFGLFRTAVADWNPIPSGSMHPNVLEGDVVFVNRMAYDLKLPLTDTILAHLGEPRRGDIVTFSSPADGTRLIKRLVALPGDRVEMVNKHLIINGQVAQYTPLNSVPLAGRGDDLHWQVERFMEAVGQQGQAREIQFLDGRRSIDSFEPITIPAGHYLMLGDNRDNSADSRFIGLVPRHLLIGKAVRILVSADIQGNWMPRFARFGQALN
jgi:signal peptidase I